MKFRGPFFHPPVNVTAAASAATELQVSKERSIGRKVQGWKGSNDTEGNSKGQNGGGGTRTGDLNGWDSRYLLNNLPHNFVPFLFAGPHGGKKRKVEEGGFGPIRHLPFLGQLFS